MSTGCSRATAATISNMYFRVPLYCQPILTNVVLQPGTNQAESATGTGGCEIFGFNEFNKTRTNTYQVGGGVIYDFDQFRVSGDIAYTDSRFTVRQINLDIGSFGAPVRNVIFDNPEEPGGPSFDLVNFDTTDPTAYRFGGLFFRKRNATGDDIQGRIDVEWETPMAALPRVQFGVRHNDRNARQRNADRFQGHCCANFTQLPITPELREPGFPYDDFQPEVTFVGFDFDHVHNSLPALRAFVGLPAADPDWNPLAEFRGNEKASAAYAQLKYEFDMGIPIDGVVGLRAVHTKTQVEGTRRDNAIGQNFAVSLSNSYTDYLPNASARVQFMPNLQMRLAYTQTRTRPAFSDLSPSATIDSPPPICSIDPNSSACFRNANGGNPNLSPINSNNYDATLEYYFSRTGSASVALFKRDLRGFIFRDTVEVIDPDFGRLRFNQPQNAGKGKIKGFEIAATTFFDYEFLPEILRGFGAQANYTYVDASTELAPNFRAQLPGQQGFPHVSKHSYNLVGMYERGPVSARLAYNFRSKFIREYLDIAGFVSPRVEDDHGVARLLGILHAVHQHHLRVRRAQHPRRRPDPHLPGLQCRRGHVPVPAALPGAGLFVRRSLPPRRRRAPGCGRGAVRCRRRPRHRSSSRRRWSSNPLRRRRPRRQAASAAKEGQPKLQRAARNGRPYFFGFLLFLGRVADGGHALGRRGDRREHAGRPVEIEISDRGDVVAAVIIGVAVGQRRVGQLLAALEQLLEIVAAAGVDGHRDHRHALVEQAEDDGFARSADLLERHLDVAVEPHRVGHVEAVEGPPPLAVPGGDRGALEAVDVGPLPPGRADIILGSGAGQRRAVAPVAVERDLDLALAPPGLLVERVGEHRHAGAEEAAAALDARQDPEVLAELGGSVAAPPGVEIERVGRLARQGAVIDVEEDQIDRLGRFVA